MMATKPKAAANGCAAQTSGSRTGGSTAWFSTIARVVIYAADNGYRVVNCSYGWLFKSASSQSAGNYLSSKCCLTTLLDPLEGRTTYVVGLGALKSKGGLLVVSAGNRGADESAPATS